MGHGETHSRFHRGLLIQGRSGLSHVCRGLPGWPRLHSCHLSGGGRWQDVRRAARLQLFDRLLIHLSLGYRYCRSGVLCVLGRFWVARSEKITQRLHILVPPAPTLVPLERTAARALQRSFTPGPKTGSPPPQQCSGWVVSAIPLPLARIWKCSPCAWH